VSICPDTPTGTAPRNWTARTGTRQEINRKRSSGNFVEPARRALGIGAQRQDHIPGHNRHVIVEQVSNWAKLRLTVVLLPLSWV